MESKIKKDLKKEDDYLEIKFSKSALPFLIKQTNMYLDAVKGVLMCSNDMSLKGDMSELQLLLVQLMLYLNGSQEVIIYQTSRKRMSVLRDLLYCAITCPAVQIPEDIMKEFNNINDQLENLFAYNI